MRAIDKVIQFFFPCEKKLNETLARHGRETQETICEIRMDRGRCMVKGKKRVRR